MAVRYAFETNRGVTQRRMLIPENPGEKLRGETFDADMIDWLHKTEQANIAAEIARQQAADTTVEFVRYWVEPAQVEPAKNGAAKAAKDKK